MRVKPGFVPASLLAALLAYSAPAAGADSDLRLSSIGFVPDHGKSFSVVTDQSVTDFVLRRADDDSAAFDGTLTGPLSDEHTGFLTTYHGSFTPLSEVGDYYIEVEGIGRTAVFRIAPDVYAAPFQAAMLGFYAWRSGTDISLTHDGVTFSHAAGHLDDASLEFVPGMSGRGDGTGGWYDAGDYGKYTVNASITLGMMLRAWEDFSESLSDVSLPIPETGGALPDYLDEVKWELDWLFKMQLFEDGRVSHKLTPYNFAGWVMPADDPEERYFSPWGSAATADFAAVMAQASRVFEPYDSAYAAQCLAAAQRAWDYLVANPGEVMPDLSMFANQQYNTDDDDERVWAAAELWESTGDPVALDHFEQNYPGVDLLWDWGNPGNLGVHTYLESTRAGRDPATVSQVEQDLTDAASELAQNALSDLGHGRAFDDYAWGINGTVARTCIALRAAYRLHPDRSEFLDACVDQIGHLFGRNYYNRSFVTGVGLDPPMHPHDRRSGADAIDPPYPGYLVGGPREGTDWVDEEGRYDLNEIANNWQGALVYALAGFLPPASEPPPPVGGAGGAGGAGGSAGTGGTAGASAGTGGSVGGSAGTGGTAGGASGTTGTGASGGAAAVGGSSGSGAMSGAAGAAGLPAGAQPASDEGGCGCRIGGSASSSHWAWLSLVTAWVAMRRRRRSRRRSGRRLTEQVDQVESIKSASRPARRSACFALVCPLPSSLRRSLAREPFVRA